MNDDHRYIASPCIRHCTLNDEDECVGCGRTLTEIKRWSVAEPEEQEHILDLAEKRLIQMKNSRGDR